MNREQNQHGFRLQNCSMLFKASPIYPFRVFFPFPGHFTNPCKTAYRRGSPLINKAKDSRDTQEEANCVLENHEQPVWITLDLRLPYLLVGVIAAHEFEGFLVFLVDKFHSFLHPWFVSDSW